MHRNAVYGSLHTTVPVVAVVPYPDALASRLLSPGGKMPHDRSMEMCVHSPSLPVPS